MPRAASSSQSRSRASRSGSSQPRQPLPAAATGTAAAATGAAAAATGMAPPIRLRSWGMAPTAPGAKPQFTRTGWPSTDQRSSSWGCCRTRASIWPARASRLWASFPHCSDSCRMSRASSPARARRRSASSAGSALTGVAVPFTPAYQSMRCWPGSCWGSAMRAAWAGLRCWAMMLQTWAWQSVAKMPWLARARMALRWLVSRKTLMVSPLSGHRPFRLVPERRQALPRPGRIRCRFPANRR